MHFQLSIINPLLNAISSCAIPARSLVGPTAHFVQYSGTVLQSVQLGDDNELTNFRPSQTPSHINCNCTSRALVGPHNHEQWPNIDCHKQVLGRGVTAR